MDNQKISFTGACLCGEIQYEISGEVKRFYHCYCQRCRKSTGTGHASNIMLKTDSFNWTQGEHLLSSYKVPEAERFFTNFCSHCGSPMPRVVPELDAVVVPAGSVEGELPVIPKSRIFWDSRAEWSCEAGGLAVYSEYPSDS